MNELLSEHGLTIGLGIVVALGAWVAFKILAPRKKEPGESIKVNVRCAKCNWQGIVSRYNRVCPKCASRDVADF